MTACLPLYRAYYNFSGLIIAPNNPARGTATRNHLTGTELDYCPEYVNEGAKLLDIAKHARGEYKLQRCALFVQFMATNIKNVLITEGNLIERLEAKAQGLANLILYESLEDEPLSERKAADMIGISRLTYRKTWCARKQKFLQLLA